MQAFTITPAQSKQIPVIASIPHTGIFVPDDISRRFVSDAVRQLPMTDWYLFELYDFLSELGVTVISANYSRYVIDLNRSPEPLELYPGRFETKLVAEHDFQGNPIFTDYPDVEQIEFYKKTVHQAYHAALEELLLDALKKFAGVFLLDLHSIAPHATKIHSELDKDIYLGDRDGQSCTEDWTDLVKSHYQQHHFSVQTNQPYKGGYITHHYGQEDNVQALQIEMNQDVYMDSDNVAVALDSEQFAKARQRLQALFVDLFKALEL